jgi:hypothetical protein
MRDESMDIEVETWPEGSLDTRLEPYYRAIIDDDPGRTGRNKDAPPRVPVEENYKRTTMDDERTEYTAPNVTLLTVKEAIAVWSREDRQELYEHLNRVYQVRMR